MIASCLSAAAPLSLNLGSSEEELYLSACSDPGSVPSSASGQWLNSCLSCCLSFPFHLQVIFPAFKCKLLRAGTVSRTSTSHRNSIAPLCPAGWVPFRPPVCPTAGAPLGEGLWDVPGEERVDEQRRQHQGEKRGHLA